MAMAALSLYSDRMSQPCRAVIMFLRLNSVPYKDVNVALRKGEHLTEEFAKVNPFKLVPVAEHNGLRLVESVAIMQYVIRTFPDLIAPNWYPTDLKRRLQVDQFTNWQHLGLRASGSMYFQNKLVLPLATGKPVNEGEVKRWGKAFQRSLTQIENIWLKDQPYVAGPEISIADLLAVTELEQPTMVGFDIPSGFPKVAEYMARVKKDTQPHYDYAHEFVYKTKERVADGSLKV